MVSHRPSAFGSETFFSLLDERGTSSFPNTAVLKFFSVKTPLHSYNVLMTLKSFLKFEFCEYS